MKNKDPLLSMAKLIRRHLRPAPAPADALEAEMSLLLNRQEIVQRLWRQRSTARRYRWPLAEQRLQEELRRHLLDLRQTLRVLTRRPQPLPLPPDLPFLMAELRQLHQEFDTVALKPKERTLAVHTEAIELEHVHLGPFSIELHLRRLTPPGSACFDYLALDPHPASSNEAVTHPHVQDNNLCAGDAAVPLTAALAQGRITDAFCLVRSVLNTYNRHSPYVALGDWNGESCHDCGHSTHPDRLSTCDGCDERFCEHCLGMCDICDSSYCPSCLDRDAVSGNRCCPSCREICQNCQRVVDRDHYHRETELCPECDREPEPQDPPQEQEKTHDSPEHQPPVPTPAPVVAE